jgi:alpha-D-ribose 1-methylphosphonate 5-triphosphate synthase subunit PhnH
VAANEHLQTQEAFRILLQALSRPGEILPFTPADRDAALPVLLQTLLDHEVNFQVIGPDRDLLAPMIADLTGSRLTEAATADFLIVTQGSSQGAILAAKRGTLEYPDQGATVIYLVAGLGGQQQDALRLKLRGPGVATARQVLISGLQAEEILALRKVNEEFPLGVDCFFLDQEGRVMGLPRSIILEV